MNPHAKYENPRRSRLEEHIELIREMRANEWPVAAIARYLNRELQVQISGAALGQFCRTRNIPDGRIRPAAPAAAEPVSPPPAAASESAGTPERVRRDRVGPDGLTLEERIAKRQKERAEQDAKYDLGLIPNDLY